MDGKLKKELIQFILAVIKVREDMIQCEGYNPNDFSLEYLLNRVEEVL